MIYTHEFNIANRELDYLWDIHFDGDDIKLYGVIGAVISGKNYFVRDLLKYRGWESQTVTLDLKSIKSKNESVDISAQDAYEYLERIWDGSCKGEILYIRHGDLKPHILLELVNLIKQNCADKFHLIIYTSLCCLDDGDSIFIDKLGDNEILPMFSRVTDKFDSFNLTIDDFKKYDIIKDYRSTGLILAISNHLRDFTIDDKESALGLLSKWKDLLWHEYEESDVAIFNTYRSIIRSYYLSQGYSPDVVEIKTSYCMDILVILSFNTNKSSLKKPLLDYLVNGDSEEYVNLLRDRCMIFYDPHPDSLFKFGCEISPFVKALIRRHLWDTPRDDYKHTSNIYATLSSLFNVKTEISNRIIRENGGLLMDLLKHITYRKINKNDYIGDFSVLETEIHNKCKMRKLNPDAVALYLYCYFATKFDDTTVAYSLSDIKSATFKVTSRPDSNYVFEDVTAYLRKLNYHSPHLEKFIEKYSLDICNLAEMDEICNKLDLSIKNHLKLNYPGISRSNVHLSTHGIHSVEKCCKVFDSELLEIRRSVDDYVYQIGELHKKSESQTIKEYDGGVTLRHLYVISHILKENKQLSSAREEMNHPGFYWVPVPVIDEGNKGDTSYNDSENYNLIYYYSDDFDIMEGCLRMIDELNLLSSQSDYTAYPLLKYIREELSEQSIFDEDYKEFWLLSTHLLIGLAEHCIDNESQQVELVNRLIGKMIFIGEKYYGANSVLPSPFSDSRILCSYYECKMALIRLSEILPHNSSESFMDPLYKLNDLKKDFCMKLPSGFENVIGYMMKDDYMESIPFFAIKPAQSTPSNLKFAILHFLYHLYKQVGDLIIDTDINLYAGSEKFEDKDYYQRSEKLYNIYGNVRNDLLFDEMLVNLDYCHARALYIMNDPSKADEIEKYCNHVRLRIINNSIEHRGIPNLSIIEIEVMILLANFYLRHKKLIDANSLIKKLDTPAYLSAMYPLQKARVEELNGKLCESLILDSLGNEYIRYLTDARNHYAKAEYYSKDTSRVWINMKMKSEVYRIDCLLNNSKELGNRSAALLTYLKGDLIEVNGKLQYKHKNVYARIVRNLMGGTSS